ncbi:MAG TPA: 4a-hydroxytetrahydrobiopterin dehydratase [Nitrososphaeraceae archaeon]|nr:4a-hydroxytetrahydrobiopterin dehydratase [Nitrososphaeraceae archaeon]
MKSEATAKTDACILYYIGILTTYTNNQDMVSNEDIEKSIAGELYNIRWGLKDGKLIKSFQFSSFMDAINFVNDVANIAERLDHHPIITINWKTVKLSLKSFDVDAITKRDITLAKEIEKKLKNR